MPSSLRSLAVCALASYALVAVGCGPERDLEPQPRVVRALWNPATGELPSPTDLVRDAERGRLDLPIDPQAPPAQQQFTGYLNSLDGFPLTSTLEVPVSDDVFSQGLRSSFFVLDLADQQPVSLELDFDAEANVISASSGPADNAHLEPGRSYVFGLRGYEGGLSSAAGEPVVADSGFFFVRSQSPLDEHPDAMPGKTRAEKQATAEQLHQIQEAYAPLIDLVTQTRGFPREELAVLASFTTTDEPAVWFDPNSGRVPLPNGLLIDPDTGQVDLPIGDDEADEVREVKEALSHYDGFSASAALVLESTHEVDADAVLDESAVRLYVRDDQDRWTQVHELDRGVLDDGKTFYIRPRLTLEPDTEYVYVTTRELTDRRGKSLRAQPLGALLRSSAPLAEQGATLVSSIDDATATRLEPVRQQAEPVLDRLEGELTPRETIGAAVPFRTLSTLDAHLARRAKLYEEDVRTDIVNVEVATPAARGLFLAMPRVETVVSGELFVLDHLDVRTRRFRADGAAEVSPASFVLTIPRGYDKGEPMPVVLFGHGLMTSRELVYLIANRLARAGYAAIAVDLPYHGKRAVCVEDSDCQGQASCDALGECIESDGSTGELHRIEVPFVDAEYPISTGFAFIDVANLIGTRDHFAQAMLDLMQTLRVVRGADWAGQADGWTLDGDDVVYLGMSLGGILGANLAAVEPTLETFVLNVPGGDYFAMIENSPTFAAEFEHGLAERGIMPGSDAYFAFENVARWLLDPVDPLNLSQHAVLEPYEYIDPVDGQTKTSPTKRVLIQMAENDAVVPNVSTRTLSERMGVDISEYSPSISNHGFLFDPTSLSGIAARGEVVDFFDAR